MDTKMGALILKEEVFRVVGAAMEVLNTLGHGLHEKPCENALAVEFGLRGIAVQQQPVHPVTYQGVKVGEFIPDLIALDAVVVDAKTIDPIADHERGQMMNCLRITGLRAGVILNLKHSKREWERIVL